MVHNSMVQYNNAIHEQANNYWANPHLDFESFFFGLLRWLMIFLKSIMTADFGNYLSSTVPKAYANLFIMIRVDPQQPVYD